MIQIPPLRIPLLNKVQLVLPSPTLDQPLLTLSVIKRVAELIPDQPTNVMLPSEDRPTTLPMLLNPTRQISRVSDIERPIPPIHHHINRRLNLPPSHQRLPPPMPRAPTRGPEHPTPLTRQRHSHLNLREQIPRTAPVPRITAELRTTTEVWAPRQARGIGLRRRRGASRHLYVRSRDISSRNCCRPIGPSSNAARWNAFRLNASPSDSLADSRAANHSRSPTL